MWRGIVKPGGVSPRNLRACNFIKPQRRRHRIVPAPRREPFFHRASARPRARAAEMASGELAGTRAQAASAASVRPSADSLVPSKYSTSGRRGHHAESRAGRTIRLPAGCASGLRNCSSLPLREVFGLLFEHSFEL